MTNKFEFGNLKIPPNGLVGAKQEDFSLSKNERSAAGGRVGQTTLGGRLSKVSSRRSMVGSRRPAVGTFSKLFLLMISLIKNFSGASRRIQKGDIYSDIS